MSAISSIEWTDRTWNPVRGCSVISPGCVNCYAMKQAHRFSGEKRTTVAGTRTGPLAYYGLTKQTKAGPQWTGVIRTVDTALLEPLSWLKPARIFVNSMSDLFHEGVPDEFIDQVFAVMALAPQHTYQILTKRPERMREYLTVRNRLGSLREAAINGAIWSLLGTPRGSKIHHGGNWRCKWPLQNVWLGVSVENQHFADERIPLLLQTPAAVRFISAEPLLGPVNLKRFMAKPMFHCYGCGRELLRNYCRRCGTFNETVTNELVGLDWVIVGGESGPGARPFDLAWARSIVQRCEAAGVACFVKQLGANPTGDVDRVDVTEHAIFGPEVIRYTEPISLRDKKGGDPSEWPEDLRVREFPEGR